MAARNCIQIAIMMQYTFGPGKSPRPAGRSPGHVAGRWPRAARRAAIFTEARITCAPLLLSRMRSMATSPTVSLSIAGMSCGHCVAAVTRALSDVTGLVDPTVAIGSARFRLRRTQILAPCTLRQSAPFSRKAIR